MSADDYERFDVSDLRFVKTHPTTAVGGTAVALRYFAGDPEEDDMDRGIAGLVVEDPIVYTGDDDGLTGSAIFEADEGEPGDDFKVVNLDDDATKEIPETGVDFDGNVFYGTKVDEIDDDQVVIKLAGSAGRSATCCLDVHGKGSAGVKEDGGQMVLSDNGYPEIEPSLLEYFNDDGDDYTPPRFYRDTQLRPDVRGETVLFMVQRMREVKEDYDGDSYWSTVLVQAEDGEGNETMTSLSPTTEFEPDDDLLRATSWLEGYPSRGEIARANIEQGNEIPEAVEEYLEEENPELLAELDA